jgi:Catechol dioxygenase N terminus
MVKKPAAKKPAKKAAKKKPKKNAGAKYFFSLKDSVKVVQDRAGPKANKRVKEVTNSLVKHLHAFVKETNITLDEWLYGIQFLTKTGHLSTIGGRNLFYCQTPSAFPCWLKR